MALMFLTIPNSDAERLRIVEWLAANGITCYLRRRDDSNDIGAPPRSGVPTTILVPEGQLQQAKQMLASMPQGEAPDAEL